MKLPLRLSRLPKSDPVKLNFRGTTPGKYSRLLEFPNAQVTSKIVDRSHPWAKKHPFSYRKKFPSFRSPELAICAYPKALLAKPDHPDPDPPFSPAPQRHRNAEGKTSVVDMSLMMSVPKSVAKSSVIRDKLRKRIKFALELIVKRGATDGKRGKGDTAKEVLMGGSSDARIERLILQKWTYVFHPRMELYRMPYISLVKRIRAALTEVNKVAQKVEVEWWTVPGRAAQTREIKQRNIGQPDAQESIPDEIEDLDEGLEKDPEGPTPLEGLKRLLGVIKEDSDPEAKEFQREETGVSDSDIILDRMDLLPERNGRSRSEKAGGTDTLLFRRTPIINPKSDDESSRIKGRRRTGSR